MSDIMLSQLPELYREIGIELTESQTLLLADVLSDQKTGDITLPEFYETAVAAIAQCEKMDECAAFKGMADIISTYAAQARDRRMLVIARRMRARAWRRLGELLLLYPVGHSGHARRLPDDLVANKAMINRRKEPPQKTRAEVSKEVGLSPKAHQKAIYIAKMPEVIFEKHVEAPDSISDHGLMMLERGPGLDRKPYVNAKGSVRHMTGYTLRKFSVFTNNHLAADLARCFTDTDAKAFVPQVRAIRSWLTSLDKAFAERP